MITNLAQFKKAMVVGSRWETVYIGQRLGLITRTIKIQQTNGVKFSPLEGQKGTGSWHYFGAAKDYSFDDGVITASFDNGSAYAKYKLIPEGENETE